MGGRGAGRGGAPASRVGPFCCLTPLYIQERQHGVELVLSDPVPSEQQSQRSMSDGDQCVSIEETAASQEPKCFRPHIFQERPSTDRGSAVVVKFCKLPPDQETAPPGISFVRQAPCNLPDF